MSKIENTADVIREALCLFEGGRRWTKGIFENVNEEGQPNYCILGAVQAVLGNGNRREGQEHPLYVPTKKVISAVIKQAGGGPSASDRIVSFNDRANRKFAQIESLLARALVRARAAVKV